jgi:hypothetical protein
MEERGGRREERGGAWARVSSAVWDLVLFRLGWGLGELRLGRDEFHPLDDVIWTVEECFCGVIRGYSDLLSDWLKTSAHRLRFVSILTNDK